MSSVNFDPNVGGDGSTVSDDASPSTGLANGGHRTRFVPALSQIVAVAQWVLAKANQVSTWATNAANSASAAAGSASSASASATAAALSLDEFTDLYLGAKAADPTVDNDGNALQLGALYARTTAPKGLKVWDGSAWLTAGLSITSAGGISVTPVGGIASSNVQAALAELDAEKLAVTGGAVTGPLELRGAVPPQVMQAEGSGYGFVQMGDSSAAAENWHFGSDGAGAWELWNGVFGSGVRKLRVLSSSGDALLSSGGTIWTSGNFTPASKQDALGYAPANRAGDTFSGLVNLGYGAIFYPGPGSVSLSGQAGCAARFNNTGFQNYGRVIELRTDSSDGPFAVFSRGGATPTNWQIGISHTPDSTDFYVGVTDNAFGGRQFRFGTDGRFTSSGPVSAPRAYASDWFRSTGVSGWWNETYAGGIYMADTTWVRTYGKSFLVEGDVAQVGNGENAYKSVRMKNSAIDVSLRAHISGGSVDLINHTAGTTLATFLYGGNVTFGGTVTGSHGTCGTNATGSKTISSSAPSGGADGDVWYQI